MQGFIYKLTCPFERKPIYVGATTDPQKRKKDHLAGRGKTLIAAYIQNLNKRKRTPLIFEIIEKCDHGQMHSRERYHIKECEKQNPYILNIAGT